MDDSCVTQQVCVEILFYVSGFADGSADGFYLFHPLLDGRLRKVGSFFEFFQDSRPLIFLFKSLYRAVDRFVFLYNNAYQRYHLGKVNDSVNYGRLI